MSDPSPPASPPPPDPVAVFHALLLRRTPHVRVVPVLLVLNVAVFVLMVARGVHALAPTADSLVPWGANYGPQTLGGEPWRLLSNVFLHFGILHIGLNMLALWNGGALIERIYGAPRFAALYVAAGLIGSVASVVTHPHTVSAGASGAVFGMYGALASFLYRQRGVIPTTVLRSMSRVAAGMIGYNLLAGFSLPGIDNAAHIGGLIGGAASGIFLVRPLIAGRDERSSSRPVVALTAAVVFSLAVVRVLPRPADLMAELERFVTTESQVREQFYGLIKRGRKGAVSDEGFAAALEDDLLPPWRSARARLGAQVGWPTRQKGIVDVLVRYAGEREQRWSELASALRAHDGVAVEDALKGQQEAERLLDALNKPK